MRKKQMLALFMSLSLLAQGMLFSGCGQKSIGEEPAQTRTETEEAQSMETSDSKKQDQTSETDENNQTAADKTPDQDVARDEENGFALRFTEALLKQKKEGENLIASPYSAWLPLAALVNGCSGATQEQLLKVIGEAGIDAETLNQTVKAVNAGLSQEERRKSYEEYGETFESPLKIANALFVQKDATVNQTFEQLFSDNYDGKLFSVDFSDPSAANAINSWASEKTDGKIVEIVDSFDADTVAAIANALYFSDSWSSPFLEENTTEGTFHGAKQDENAEFMNQKLSDGIYYEDETMQAIVLWTASGGQMVLCLPKDGYSAEEVLQSLTTEKLQKISGADYRCVQLSLPKFKLESNVFSIKEALEAMGIPLMQATDAALTEVLDNEALYISSALQSAMVEVDENGLTAAAVTAMGLEKMALMPETDPIELTFDSPFAFVLTGNGEDAGDQILFTGVVNHL